MEDFDYNEQIAITQYHWSLEDYDSADYFELARIMKAKDKSKRAADPLTAIAGIRKAAAKRKRKKG